MTNGDDLAKFEEENFEALVEDFVETHREEMNDYLADTDGEYGSGLEVWKEFATNHPEWSRFVEIEYATRGREQ